jgi:glycosyltransferase involved in cell wall biosynthesis
MLTLADAQRNAGHNVTLICFKGMKFVQEARELGYEVHEVKVRGKLDPIAVRAVAKFLKREKVDVLHAHLSTSSVNGCLAARLAGIPSVASVHGLSGKLSFVFATHLIGVSNAVKAHLVEQGVSPNRITVVYNGTDPPAHNWTKAVARHQFHFDDGELIFGTVARLTPLKGVSTAIEAFAIIAEKLPDSRFLIVGDGPEVDALQALAEQLGVADHVVFAGYRQDVYQCLQAIDIFLFPSQKEAMGLAVAEALALGIPVVSTNVGGLPEVIDSTVGALVPPEDPVAMAKAALVLAVNPEHHSECSVSAINRWRERFSIRAMHNNVEEVYRNLIK